jgi:hypothetical protein
LKLCLLSGPGSVPGAHNYQGTDSLEQRSHLKKIYGPTWKYYNKTITYTNNSNGYRAPEWDQVDWNNSVLVMGCSNVHGCGHDDEDTLPKRIERKINMPVVNLGANGTGLSFHVENTNILLAAGINPKAVVLMHPQPARFTYFFKSGFRNILPGRPDKLHRDMWSYYAYDDNHINKMQEINSTVISNMWPCPVIKYSFSWEDHIIAYPAVEYDQSADDMHPGDETFDRLSSDIAADINRQLSV